MEREGEGGWVRFADVREAAYSTGAAGPASGTDAPPAAFYDCQPLTTHD